jgi:hypothetical protein
MDVDSAPVALGRLGAPLWQNTDGQAAIGTGFKGDGHSDMLWQNASGQAAIWEMNGNTIAGGGLLTRIPGRAGMQSGSPEPEARRSSH